MVGLAALGHLLHVAEELIEGSIAGTAPLTEETLAILRDEHARSSAAIWTPRSPAEPLEPVALGLARALRQDDGPEAVATLRVLLEIEAREMAWLPAERVEPPADAAEALAVTPVLTETIEADDDRWTLVQTDTIEADDARCAAGADRHDRGGRRPMAVPWSTTGTGAGGRLAAARGHTR